MQNVPFILCFILTLAGFNLAEGREDLSFIDKVSCASTRPSPGNCYGSMIRYYYNAATKRCQTFKYGGCGTEVNNFQSKAECERAKIVCEYADTVEDIRNPKMRTKVDPNSVRCDETSAEQEGLSCFGHFERYFYNAETNECEKFVYGGCGKDANNFKTMDECLAARAICLEKKAKTVLYQNDSPIQQTPLPDDIVGQFSPETALCDESSPSTDGPTCLAYIISFFYNSKTDKCEQFVYGGCGKVKNNYSSLKECKKAKRYCHRTVGARTNIKRFEHNRDVTSKRKQSGRVTSSLMHQSTEFHPKNARCHDTKPFVQDGPTCLAYIPSYFYNALSDQCEKFIYSGCGKKENNYASLKECEKAKKFCSEFNRPRIFDPNTARCDDHRITIFDGNGKYCGTPVKLYYFDALSDSCETITFYEKCTRKENVYDFIDECKKAKAYCHAVNKIFSSKSNELQDSATIFQPTTADCEEYELDVNEEKFRCYGSITSYYYNAATDKCEEFIYGGCGRDKNTFVSMQECAKARKYCKNQPRRMDRSFIDNVSTKNDQELNLIQETVICDEDDPSPKGQKQCLAYFPRYFYNGRTKRCERFVYGGCGKDKNNYRTKEECNKAKILCERKKQENQKWKSHPAKIISIDAVDPTTVRCDEEDPTPEGGMVCYASFQRYFYNARTRKCEEFTYGGCGKDTNNFHTITECNKAKAYCEKHNGGGRLLISSTFDAIDPETVRCNEHSPDTTEFSCKAYIPRYFYNSETDRCEKFIYGGCGKEYNNYESKISCERAKEFCHNVARKTISKKLPENKTYEDIDITALPVNSLWRKETLGLTDKSEDDIPIYFTPSKARCDEKFLKHQGKTCLAYIPAYYYNSRKDSCDKFIYGGCGRTKNTYSSKKQCERARKYCHSLFNEKDMDTYDVDAIYVDDNGQIKPRILGISLGLGAKADVSAGVGLGVGDSTIGVGANVGADVGVGLNVGLGSSNRRKPNNNDGYRDNNDGYRDNNDGYRDNNDGYRDNNDGYRDYNDDYRDNNNDNRGNNNGNRGHNNGNRGHNNGNRGHNNGNRGNNNGYRGNNRDNNRENRGSRNPNENFYGNGHGEHRGSGQSGAGAFGEFNSISSNGINAHAEGSSSSSSTGGYGHSDASVYGSSSNRGSDRQRYARLLSGFVESGDDYWL